MFKGSIGCFTKWKRNNKTSVNTITSKKQQINTNILFKTQLFLTEHWTEFKWLRLKNNNLNSLL